MENRNKRESEYSLHVIHALNEAKDIAKERRHSTVDIPTVLFVLLNDKKFQYVQTSLEDAGLKNISGLKKIIEQKLESAAVFSDKNEQTYEKYLEENNGVNFSRGIANILSSVRNKREIVTVNDVMNEIVENKDYKDIFKKYGLNIETFLARECDYEIENNNTSDQSEIKKYLVNLNEKVEKELEKGIQTPIIGRSNEIRALINVISKKGKKNPVLVGKAGVGKTAIIEGFVLRLLKGDVPKNLKDKKVLMLDLNALNAGAKFRGDIEERMKKIMKYIEGNDEVILFIDEIHSMLNSGKTEGSVGVGGMLKTSLARGGITCVGTTTFDEYREYIEKDKAMERRFMKIVVNESTEEEAIAILRGIKEVYEQYHGVYVSDDAIIASVKLSERYMKDRCLPDKAIDLLDMGCARLKIENDTVPELIDIELRELEQIELQLASLEGNPEKNAIETRNKLKEEKSAIKFKLTNLNEKLEEEKAIISKKQDLQKQLSIVDNKINQLTVDGEYEEASKLKNSDRIEILKEMEAINAQINDENDECLFELLKLNINAPLIADIVSDQTGIPLKKLLEGEADKLVNLEDFISKRVVGQKEATEAISDVIRISKTGIGRANKPLGSFLFLGPTGVGKTEITKALAETIFDDEREIIRFDMSEYSEEVSSSKLIGSNPGYVGYESGGLLTEAVKRKPYSIILFDEIEKAHKKFFDILLQVLDDGRLTDNKGTTVDFTNTIIIMTSNIGSNVILEKTDESVKSGEEIDRVALNKEIMDLLKYEMRPEFINRINEIIIFNALRRENIDAIAKIQLNKLMKRVNESQNFTLSYDDAALNEIAEIGFDPLFGARPLERAINRNVEKPLSKAILLKKFKQNDQVCLTFKDGEFDFIVKE